MPTPAPHCARCGYDLSGQYEALDEPRPETGRCAECGTEFRWAEALDPESTDVPAYFEHASGRLELLRAAVVTWAWSLWPPLFWSRVHTRMRTDARRMLLWLLMITVPPHLLASAAGLISGWAHNLLTWQGSVDPWQVVSYVTFPFATLRRSSLPTGVPDCFSQVEDWPWYILPSLAFSLAWPLLMILLPATRRLAKLKDEHVLRAAVFGLAWLAPLSLFRLARNTWGIFTGIADLRYVPAPGMPPTYSPARLNDFAPEVVGILLLAWISWWWFMACTKGWRLRHAGLVWVLLTVASGLVAAVMAARDDLWGVYFSK